MCQKKNTVRACIDRSGTEHVFYLDFEIILAACNVLISKLGKNSLNITIYRSYESIRKTILRR